MKLITRVNLHRSRCWRIKMTNILNLWYFNLTRLWSWPSLHILTAKPEDRGILFNSGGWSRTIPFIATCSIDHAYSRAVETVMRQQYLHSCQIKYPLTAISARNFNFQVQEFSSQWNSGMVTRISKVLKTLHDLEEF